MNDISCADEPNAVKGGTSKTVWSSQDSLELVRITSQALSQNLRYVAISFCSTQTPSQFTYLSVSIIWVNPDFV